MIRVIVFAVIGLVIGLGGGSGVAVMRAKKTLAAAHDSAAKSDSTKKGSTAEGAKTAGDGTPNEVGEHPAVASQAPDSVAVAAQAAQPKQDSAAAPSGAAHAPSTPTVAAAKTPGNDSSHAGTSAVPGRIAKIFAAMSAKDAARVLQQMDDADVQTVLGGLNDRQAAAILAGFPPERAAAISRSTLRKKGTS